MRMGQQVLPQAAHTASACCQQPWRRQKNPLPEAPSSSGRFLLVVSLSSLAAISWPPSLKRKRQLFGVGICWMFFLTLTNSSRASSKDNIYHQIPDTNFRISHNQLRTKTCHRKARNKLLYYRYFVIIEACVTMFVEDMIWMLGVRLIPHGSGTLEPKNVKEVQ